MTDSINQTQSIESTLRLLLATPNMRPFLFRTRLERSMIRLISYAKETNQPKLAQISENTRDKLRLMSNRSAASSEGVLQIYAFLQKDIENVLETLKHPVG